MNLPAMEAKLQEPIVLDQIRVLDPQAGIDRPATVLLHPETPPQIDPDPDQIPASVRRQAASGQILAPGLVDLHSRSGEPGHEDRETWDSLAAAAIAGGFTQVAVLPNTTPALDDRERLQQRQRSRHHRSRDPRAPQPSTPPPQFHYWGAITQGCQGKQMTDLAELAQAGAIGFSDGVALEDWTLIRRVLDYSQSLKRPIALWPWNPTLAGSGTAWDGPLALHYGLPGLPYLTETIPLAGLLETIAELGTPIHLMRVTTARGVELVAQAKAQGLPVTASTTWMHLVHSTEDLATYDPHLHLIPPVGNVDDRSALQAAVQSGILDAIAVDHTPCTYEEKTVAFGEAPAGAIGLELALAVLWHTFVAPGHWSAADLWHRLSIGPAQILGLAPPSLSSGTGGWLWFDPAQSWTVSPATLQSRSPTTPYLAILHLLRKKRS
ncbi:MAG: dihydroorotase, partial [Prochlorothrix sp.]